MVKAYKSSHQLVLDMNLWEANKLDEGETAMLFQYLIQNHIVDKLDEKYQNMAKELIAKGKCHEEVDHHE